MEQFKNVNELKKQIEENLNIKIDFRSDVYVINTNGAVPVMGYVKAEAVVREAIDLLWLDTKYVNWKQILNNLELYTLKSELSRLIKINIG